MKPSSYWQKRFEQLKRDELLATNGSLDQTRKLYDRIEHSIEKDLAYWYGRYMKNNEGVSYADAQKALSKKELAEFRWTVEDYIEKAKTLELSPKWHKALENASIKAHVTRLESLKLQLSHHSEVLHDTLNKNLGKDLRKVYEGQYYKNLFEIQKGLGQGRLIEALDPSFLDLVIHKPWHKDGLDFSSRIWQARDKLIHTLEQELTYIAIRGDSPDGAIRRISQLFGKSRSHSAMLVQTEHAALASRAQQDAFKALDVEEFEYIATLDGKTSELCQSMDGKHFPMSEYQVGLTAPPLHPRCRSCTAPYFEDMEAPRWARDKDGKGYVIGEEVKFKDWQDEYVVKASNASSSVVGVVANPLRLEFSEMQKPKLDSVFSDITSQWTVVDKSKRIDVKDLDGWTHEGKFYPIDGKDIFLDYDAQEKAIAELLADYGKEVLMVPRVLEPKRVSTPDYLVDGERWDLKTLKEEAGENTIYNRLYKAKRQAIKFVVDLTNTSLTQEIVDNQVKYIAKSQSTKHVKLIIFVRNRKIVQVFER